MKTKNQVKPSIVPTFYKLHEELTSLGLNDDDIVHLIHKRVRGKVSVTDVRTTLNAVVEFEKQIEKKLAKKLS